MVYDHGSTMLKSYPSMNFSATEKLSTEDACDARMNY